MAPVCHGVIDGSPNTPFKAGASRSLTGNHPWPPISVFPGIDSVATQGAIRGCDYAQSVLSIQMSFVHLLALNGTFVKMEPAGLGSFPTWTRQYDDKPTWI